MHKYVWRVLVVCICGCFLASVALAKIWLLPDYQARQFYSHRVNDLDSSTPSRDPQGVNCHTYGLISASEIGEGMSCSSQTKIMNTTCYGNCVCAPSYNKTESSCRLEGKIPGGSVCMGEYYTECLCDTSLYPYTLSSCDYSLKGASCSDDKGKHFAECIDPCEGLVDNSTEQGCEKYYDECPSLCEIGDTCVRTDCSAYTFDTCPEGYNCDACIIGCGNETLHYRPGNCLDGYYLVDGQCTKIEGEIALTFNIESSGTVGLYLTVDDYKIDWGDGSITRETAKTPKGVNATISHTYSTAGDYRVRVEGNIQRFALSSSSTADLIRLNRLDLETVTSYESAFGGKCENTTGTIPALPKNLTNGRQLFDGCSKLTGDTPVLPDSLTDAFAMFRNCSGLDGKITSLGKGLTKSSSMFSGCSKLTGDIPALPSGLTDGSSMFTGCSNLTGDVPALPDGLTTGRGMFANCSGLTGNIPNLPNSLTDGYQMFYHCSGLTGDVPALPDSLTTAYAMFGGCSSLDGKITSLGKSLTSAKSMFADCSKLTGDIPALPDTLTDGSSMFQNCSSLDGKITSLGNGLTKGEAMFKSCTSLGGTIPALPETLTSGSKMFSQCKNLTGGVPALPDILTNGTDMFSGCSGLTGTITALPSSLTKGNNMFLNCSGLTGEAPAKPTGLTSYSAMFKGTQIPKNVDWPSNAW